MSRPSIAVLSPGHPETKGGVTDHTTRIARQWRAAGHGVHILPDRTTPPARLAGQMHEAGVVALLIQYVPFLYGRRGISSFPEAVAREAAARDVRVTVFVHEPWVPFTRPSWWLLSPLQRRQLRRLLRQAHTCVTPVPAWQRLLGSHADVVYVGSNLGNLDAEAAVTSPPRSSPVVFSPFAAGLNWKWIAAAVQAIDATPPLTVVGADAAAGRRHPATRAWARDAWDWLGYLPPGEALAVLGRARVALAPFIDGATGRRTSLLASLSTGVEVISATGPLLDPVFGDGPVMLASTEAEFVRLAADAWSAADRADRRHQRIAWYARHFDPVALDQRLLRAVLGGAGSGGP